MQTIGNNILTKRQKIIIIKKKIEGGKCARVLSKVTPKPGSALNNKRIRKSWASKNIICSQWLVCVRNIILARANCQKRRIRTKSIFYTFLSLPIPMSGLLSIFFFIYLFSDDFSKRNTWAFFKC